MATFDQMIIDDRDLANRYFGENNLDDLDDDQYLFPKQSTNNQQKFHSKPLSKRDSPNKNDDDDNTGLFGRRVFLESPLLGNKEEEDMYRFVPSRLSDHESTVIGRSAPAPTGETLIDSLDFELDLIGATNTRHKIPYRTQLLQESKPPAPLTQLTNPLTPMTNMRRADPRQDPLLGPLLAELDAMSTQQQRLTQPPPPPLPPPAPTYRRNSMPYEPNLTRPPGLSQTNHALTTTANRTVNDALLEAELYDSLDPRDEQFPPIQQRQPIPLSAPSINSTNHPQQQQHQPHQQYQQQHQQYQHQQHQQYQQQQQQQYQQQQHPQHPQHQLPNRRSNMNSTDVFMPSSYDNGPAAFLSHFGPEDQLFQQPLLNAIGQNYVPNPRALPPSQQQQQQQQQHEQRETSFDNSHTRTSPSHRTVQQPSNNNNQYQQQPPANQQITYNDNNDPFSEYHDMYAPPQYQRPPPVPSQQRPPPSQQQRTMPPPPSQQKYQRPPPPSQRQQQQYYEEQTPHSNQPSNNQEMFFTDHNDDQLDQFSYQQLPPPPPPMSNQHNVDQQHDQDSRRQAVWNELQRTNAKVQEKNAKKRESANRREQMLKGTYGSNNAYNNSQQSSAQSKPTGNSSSQRRPPPIPVSKTNYIEDNIDMIKNKENFYHRYPAKKYENLYTKRKDLGGEGNNEQKNEQNQDARMDYDQTQSSNSMNNPVATYSDTQHRASLPVTFNLNPDNSQGGNLPGSVTIPLDSNVTRMGDKISVNIDLRLVDLQNLKKQQQNDRPDWSGLDPLDRHIRKLERSIDHSLPPTHPPTDRTPTFSNTGANASMGRYGKNTRGAGYSPPNYGSEYYSYSDKGREEDSYLAKMNHVKQGPHFKPYTGRDYEQFKKNYEFGTGTLGFDFDNPNYKEKNDKLVKTKEYAQQIEARNKKILAEAPRRTLSDTRIPTETSKTQRALEYARVSTRHKPPSGTSTNLTPPDMNGSGQANRRPTEVLHRPSPMQKQPIKLAHNGDNELVERLAMRHEHDKAQVQGILNPSQKRREQLFDDDDRRVSDIERLAQDRANQRRLSPPRQVPPTNNGNARRPLRFDKPLVPDESTYSPQQQYRPVQQQQQHQQPILDHRQPSGQQRHTPQEYEQQEHQHQEINVNELAIRHNDEKMLMEAIRQELSERPLGDDEELVVVEQQN